MKEGGGWRDEMEEGDGRIGEVVEEEVIVECIRIYLIPHVYVPIICRVLYSHRRHGMAWNTPGIPRVEIRSIVYCTTTSKICIQPVEQKKKRAKAPLPPSPLNKKPPENQKNQEPEPEPQTLRNQAPIRSPHSPPCRATDLRMYSVQPQNPIDSPSVGGV